MKFKKRKALDKINDIATCPISGTAYDYDTMCFPNGQMIFEAVCMDGQVTVNHASPEIKRWWEQLPEDQKEREGLDALRYCMLISHWCSESATDESQGSTLYRAFGPKWGKVFLAERGDPVMVNDGLRIDHFGRTQVLKDFFNGIGLKAKSIPFLDLLFHDALDQMESADFLITSLAPQDVEDLSRIPRSTNIDAMMESYTGESYRFSIEKLKPYIDKGVRVIAYTGAPEDAYPFIELGGIEPVISKSPDFLFDASSLFDALFERAMDGLPLPI